MALAQSIIFKHNFLSIQALIVIQWEILMIMNVYLYNNMNYLLAFIIIIYYNCALFYSTSYNFNSWKLVDSVILTWMFQKEYIYFCDIAVNYLTSFVYDRWVKAFY